MASVTVGSGKGDKRKGSLEGPLGNKVMNSLKRLLAGSGRTKQRRVYAQINLPEDKIDTIKKQLEEAKFDVQYKIDEKTGKLMIAVTGIGDVTAPEQGLSFSDNLNLPPDESCWPDGKPEIGPDGKISTRTYMPPNGKEICDKINEDLRKHGRKTTEYKGIEYVNGVPRLDDYSFGTAKIPFFSTEREVNFKQARQMMADDLNKRYGGKRNPKTGELLLDPKTGEPIPYTDKDVENWIKDNNMVLHEEGDCETINKVPCSLHNTTVLRHRGGYSNNKQHAKQTFNVKDPEKKTKGKTGNDSLGDEGTDNF